jgi:hypothetical protein
MIHPSLNVGTDDASLIVTSWDKEAIHFEIERFIVKPLEFLTPV